MTIYPCIDIVLIKIASDAWHRNALGLTGRTIWCLLLAGESLTPKMISKRTGRGISTVSRSINKLFRYGLIEPLGNGYYTSVIADQAHLQSIAVEKYTNGSCKKRKQRYQRERESQVSLQILRQKWYWNKRHGL